MEFPAGTEAAVYELRAKLGVPAAVIHLHFADDGSLQKIIPEVVFKKKKPLDPRESRAHT